MVDYKIDDNKFCLGYELFEEEEKMRKEMNLQIDTATEQLLLNDIIDIYNNKYSKYDDYYKYIVDYNNKARESNIPKISGYCEGYRFSFTPLKRILLIRQFNYIRELGLKDKARGNVTKIMYDEAYYKRKRTSALLGFDLTCIETPAEHDTIRVTDEGEIFISGDDIYGTYPKDKAREVIKQLLSEYLSCCIELERREKWQNKKQSKD